MDDKDNKRGFSGLSNLASEVNGIDETVRPEPKAKAKTSKSQQPPQPQQETPPKDPEQKATSSPPIVETVSTGKSGGGSGGKWILGIIAVVFVIWLINNGGQNHKKPSYNLPSSSKIVNYPQNSPAPTVATSHHNRPTPQQILEVQKLLKSLDYDPGPIDGKYGSRTANAVMAFQKDISLSQNGGIDQDLINLLKKASTLNIPQNSRPNNSYANQKKLAQEIENGKVQAKKLERQMENMDNRLEDYERRMKSYRASGMTDEYNLLVPDFNSLVKERNNLYKKYSSLINEVNAKVNRYNSIYSK